MNRKAKAKGIPATKAAVAPRRPPTTDIPGAPGGRLDAQARWVRTSRYGWDKGGSRGGRR